MAWGLGVTIVGRSFTALDPDPSDAQLFAYIGLKWTQGYIPYVDIWDHKPPGIFAVNGVACILVPKSFTVLAFLEGVFILGCIGTVYGLTRQWQLPWPAPALATTAVAIGANLIVYNEHGNLPEVYMLWPTAMSMYCFGKAAPTFQGPWVVLAGVSAGAATLFKPTGLAPLLAQTAWLLLLWAMGRSLSGRQLLASALTNGAGVLIAWLPAALYFWQHGAIGELVHASILYNVRYGLASQATGGQGLLTPFTLASTLQPLASLIVTIGIGIGLTVARVLAPRHDAEPNATAGRATCAWWLLALLWVGADLAGALAGGRNYRHYFLPLTSSLAVAAACTYGVLIAPRPREAQARGIKLVIFALIIGPLLIVQAADVGQVLRWVLRPTERPGISPWQVVAHQLTGIKRPGDMLFTWDYFPGIYLATEMNSPSRHMDTHNMYDFPAAHEQYGTEIWQALRREPPTFILDGWTTPSDEPLRARDPLYVQFRAWLEVHYVLIGTADGLKVYQHLRHRERIGE